MTRLDRGGGVQLHYPGQRRRRRQQHELQRSSTRTRTFFVFLVIPVLLAAWCIGTVILLHVSSSRDDAQRKEHEQQPAVAAAVDSPDSPLIRKRESENDECEIYGCPIYPPEIDDVIVNQTLLRLEKTTTDSNHSWFATTKYATITRQSNQHEFNQDRSVIFTPFLTLQTPRQDTKSFFVAIFDGHGVLGHLLADHVQRAMPRLLATKLNARPCCQSSAWISQQLNDTFVEVSQQAPPDYALRGGCTASVSLRIGNRLFVANAGDSRTILVKFSHYSSTKNGSNGQVMKEGGEYVPDPSLASQHQDHWSMGNTTIENGIVHAIPYMSRKDKAHLPDERARIQQLNGTIHIPPHNPSLSRVVVFSAAAQPPENIGLAMSRSLGDWEWKRVGVTAEPIVHVLDLQTYCQHPTDANSNTAAAAAAAAAKSATADADAADHDDSCSLLLIAASDGVWDLRRPEFYAKRFRESFFPTTINNHRNSNENAQRRPIPFHRHLLEACVNIFWQVAPAQAPWYRDDMSVIVMEANP